MANDIDMWNDIERMEKNTKHKERAEDLLECYIAAYINFEEEIAEQLKDAFEKKWGGWGNYY